MPPPRHGRRPTFSKPTIAVVVLVVVGVVGVGLFADVGLALRLAIGGALLVSVMIWSVYAEALREARNDHAHERALHRAASGELATLRREHEEAVRTLSARVALLEAELRAASPEVLATVGTEDDMWPDLSEAPTIVDMAGRRDARHSERFESSRSALDSSADSA